MTQLQALTLHRTERRLALQAARRGDTSATRAHNATAARYLRLAFDARERDMFTPRDAPPCEIDEAREFRMVKLQLDLMAY